MRYLSLCSGIEAATIAWAPLGWQPAAFAENDRYCSAVLAHHWPHVPNLGDITKLTSTAIAELGPLDLVVGGTPCQDLSVAGKRAGLKGTRSALFFHYARLFNAARRFCGARFALWENVPGALTNRGGRDFAQVVSTLAGADLEPPRDGWDTEGLALGKIGLLEWGVLDAQWFGVAQRRERLFALVDSGRWHDRAPVLLERESVRGDHPPRRAPGARASGTLTARALDGSSPCGGDGREGLLVAGPLLSNSHGAGPRTGAEEATGNHVIVEEIAEPLTAMNARNYTHEGNNFRLRNVVACFDETQLTHPENRSACDPETAALASSAKPPAVALAMRDREGLALELSTVSPALRSADGGASRAMVSDVAVRRLTPRECERLQGFPDDFTEIPYRPKRRRAIAPAADTLRYAALGNSMAVPVLAWIGRKLDHVLA
jgi:DNA (cytosine-5)-methyltransferase 1